MLRKEPLRSTISFSFLRGPSRTLLALAVVAAPLGCSRGQSAEERQLAELRDELARVQTASDEFEQRLGKLEVDAADVHVDPRLTDLAPTQGARSLAAPIVTPPSLRVVRLGPDGLEESSPPAETAGSLESADPDDGSPRPRIQIKGSGGEATVTTEKGARPRKVKNDRLDDTSSFSDASGNVPRTKPSALDPDARRAYDSALALVNAKKYGQALDALAGFLVRWPDHPNADNATFWRGECYFAQGAYAEAAEQFEGVVARFPLGNKMPDALLKLGLTQQHLGHEDLARQYFDRLRHDFPHAEATRRIPQGAREGAKGTTSGENP